MKARTARWSDRARDPQYSTGNCSTGKREYVSKADARLALKRMRGTTGHLDAYLCRGCDRWHVGHLPKMVIRGDATRGDL